MNYHKKNIVVLGLGQSGFGAARLLKQAGATVTVNDSGDNKLLRERAQLLETQGIRVHLGESACQDNSLYDQAILSPGIEESTPLVLNVTSRGTPLIGELELAFSFCRCPIVAITGTNGKTTTTELTVEMLKGIGMSTVACGNIGLPFSEVAMECERYDVVVVEVSSFQLETTEQFHPKVSVWLNFSPNHLDRYASVEAYRLAKMKIFEHQTSDDIAVLPKNFQKPESLHAKTVRFSAKEVGGDFSLESNHIYYQGTPFLDMATIRLRGIHNAENLMAAFAVGISLGGSLEKMADAINEYTPPEHRCELVIDQGGVQWVNDSKSTTLDSLEKALGAIDSHQSLILIAGGKDKGFSFKSMASLVQKRVNEAILIGEMRESIARDWSDVPCHLVESMEEAVLLAQKKALPQTTVLLSPGTSSYDMFCNYRERGDVFKKAVHSLY